MKKSILALLIAGCGTAFTSFAMQGSNMTTAAVDTRNYLLIVSSPFGEPVPAVGTNTYAWHATITGGAANYVVEGRTNHNCLGWEATGSVTNGTGWVLPEILLTNLESTITWLWDDEFLIVVTNILGNGTVFPGSAWVPAGSNLSLVAIGDYGWLFTGWGGDATGAPAETNLVITATGALDISASFSDDPDGDGLLNVDEWANNADPWNSDTDGDKFGDKLEVDRGWNPAKSDTWAVDYILSNKTAFGHYTSDEVADLYPGGLLINASNGVVKLHLDVETSTDLQTWTNAGETVEWSMPADAGKSFYRVRSSK